ncbi:unnamed protein product [Phaedon cochleariae]|uniref:Lipase domain-containing protein n=1 Tax=Phaedon cochleariae TaxID=80249 RepID=A0A9N9SIA6_PHACE|nr:unnamed protein product [Phaedon cochleariae]
MWLKIVTLVCIISEIGSLLYPLVRDNQVYNYVPPENDVEFNLYHRDDLEVSDRIYVEDGSSLNKSRFDAYLPTKIIIHGWTHGDNVPWMIEMREALAQSGTCNVFVVDWSNLSHVTYIEARIHNTVVAKQLTKLLLLLAYHRGISMSSIHLIGHSMGGQISANVGMRIKNQLGQKIGRITGLDPAAPLYEWPHIESLDEILDPTDASFVDVIHTNARHLGMVTPAGHVDYYPNGGDRQEGCIFWICDHIRACEYFIASIRKPDLFNAFSYKDLNEYARGRESQLESYPMGINANPEIPFGIYYVKVDDTYKQYVESKTTLSDSYGLNIYHE